MKTAISVPTEVYEQAEELARRTGRTRSEIPSTASRAYLAHQHTLPEPPAMHPASDDIAPKLDPFLDATAPETMAGSEW